MNIDVKKYNDSHIKISCPSNKPHCRAGDWDISIHLYRTRTLNSEGEFVDGYFEINWSAYGNQDFEFAKRFRKVLGEALVVMSEENKKIEEDNKRKN